jgi:hypothetical protein
MDLPARKAIELRRKLACLGNEFDCWCQQSKANTPFEKHHSQIRRITTQLTEFQASLDKEIETLATQGDALLAQCQRLEQRILELHRIWEFFRGKLALRGLPWFHDYLAAADEFCWACYRPARERAVAAKHVAAEDVKQPPLVFFSGASSPLARARNAYYEAEAVPGEELQTPAFVAALKALPVPVISIPWFQLAHLPDALILGHEVGHLVEDDLRLTDRLGALLKGVFAPKIPELRQVAWRAWLGEVFADLYGTVAAGPAFVSALIDFVALDEATVGAERQAAPSWKAYPPTALRILIGVEALKQIDFPKESAELKTIWTATYKKHAMPEFESDVQGVVKALLDGPYPELGGVGLATTLSFSAQDQAKAVRDAEKKILKERMPEANEVRCLFAAARLAFALAPETYGEPLTQERVLKKVLAIQEVGVRGGVRGEGTKEAEALMEHDKAAGRRLYDRLK